MKKFLFLGAMAAMLLGTASCSNEMEPEMTDGTVQFKVELPGNVDSRAISDGTTAKKLDVACYDADGNVLTNINPVVTPFNERVATVTVKLVKGQKYNFAFFAHAENAPYQFNAGAKLSECTFSVTDGYTGEACLSNAENRDAFYATYTDYEVTSATTEVTLYRPFAQLNFGTDDLAAAEAAGIIPGTTKVTVKKVATAFNLSTGATTGEVDATFDFAERPAETLTVESKDYAWMAMNYFLVPNNEANVDVEMTVNTNKQPVVVPVTSVPVKKNHRTNILGSLFTQEGNFKVIIDQNFDTPDYNVDPEATVFNVTSNDELDAALHSDAKKIVINLPEGRFEYKTSAYNSIPNGPYGGANTQSITIKGAGVDQTTFVGRTTYWSNFTTSNPDCVLTLKDMSVTSEGNSATTWDAYDYAIDCGDFKAENVKFLKPVSFCNIGKKSEMKDVYIDATNTPSEAYAIWQEAGTNLTLENCFINAASTTSGQLNRCLKISDQYINNPLMAYLKVINCTFKSDKKAAILVGNKAGANITVDGIDISGVAADQTNAVWVDGNYKNYSSLVTVTGATCIDEP